MSQRVEVSDEVKKAQREVKKLEDAIRKIESGQKKHAAGSPEFEEAQTKINESKARIAELCAEHGIESKADKKAANSGAAAGNGAGKKGGADAAAAAAAKAAEIEAVKAKLAATTDTAEMIALVAQLQALLGGAPAGAASAAEDAAAKEEAAKQKKAADEAAKKKKAAEEAAKKAEEEAKKKAAAIARIPTEPDVLPKTGTSAAIHPRFLDLAIRTRQLQIIGGNARALALIDTIAEFITDSIAASSSGAAAAEGGGAAGGSSSAVEDDDTSYRALRDFLEALNANIDAVRRARPLCSAMEYVIATLTLTLSYDAVGSQLGAKARALEAVRAAGVDMRNRIDRLAGHTSEVAEDDTILVFGRSSAVEMLLTKVAEEREEAAKKKAAAAAVTTSSSSSSSNGGASSSPPIAVPNRLQVIVLDAAPLFEGRGLAQRLQARGVAVRYALAANASQVMPLCTKVFLGASSVMRSGDVVGRCGTAMVAACAKSARRPVFVFAEAHKMETASSAGSKSELTTAGFFPKEAGETAHQRALFAGDGAAAVDFGGADRLYDVTPAALISIMVTDIGRMHPASASLVLRLDEEPEGNL